MIWRTNIGVVKWITQGDANTSFFHSCANGRRRKSFIFSLDHERGGITKEAEIRDHIYKFYKDLFGKDNGLSVDIATDFWEDKNMITEEDNISLVRNFTEKKYGRLLKG